MVIFVEWHRTAVDQRRSSSLPMTGEDTGLGALASPLAGYLGKVHERAASLEYCPWCTSKGLTYALRSYHINLQESITLCTNPQCLFPLVSQPLEDVLASLDPVEPAVGNKRKNAFAVEKEEVIKPSPKRLRSSEPDSLGPQNATDAHLSPAEPGAVNGQHAATKTDSGKVNGYRSDRPVAETTGWKDEDVQKGKPENAACTDGLASPTASAGHPQSSSEALLTDDGDEPVFSPHHGASEAVEDFGQLKSTPELLNKHCSLDSNQSSFTNADIYSTEIKTPSPQQNAQTSRTEQKSMTADITARKDIVGVKSETEDLSSTSIMESEVLESALSHPFWRNSDSLCWLDALLVALVNCKSLKTRQPKDEPQCSSVWQLIKGYEDACAAIQVHQQTGKDGVVRVPNHVLEKANSDLQSLRTSLFKLLQPKLRCKLGRRETPVFAMPLMLTMDSWAESLFQSTFHWEFKCSGCKTSTKERATKTLPTFTNIVPDWHPLHAVHLAPCNVCHKTNQSRTLMLERVPPVFALHFVEGLPDNDVTIYTFNFKGKRYSVTTVIQYNQHLKHFVTWICQSDGSWLEFDDLKHPDCKTHLKLPVPAQEMHIVFWEAEEDKEPCACSPSSTFAECLPSKHGMNGTNLIADEQLSCTPDQSLLISQNDTDIVCALSGDSSNIMDTTDTAGVDTSIGSTTLLDTFEGLTHNDIITLTLVELKADSETQPLNDDEQTQDPRVPSRNETPDSSSVILDSQMSHGHDIDFSSTSISSEPESGDGSSSDPSFVPSTRRGRGTGRAVAKNKTESKQPKGKKAARTKAAPPVSPPVSSELSNNSNNPVDDAAQDNTPPVETTQQLSPESSTDTNSPATQPSLDQNARWSFLLSKHPLNHVHKSIAKLPPTPTPTPTSVKQIKPTRPPHSTPNPVRRQQTPVTLFPKPQLRMEESDGLPPKAAEMYGAFGSTNSNTPSPLPSPALLNGKSKFSQPITSDHQKPLRNTTAMSGTSLPALGVKRFPEISSSKKQSHQTSKLPPGLSDTDALRYKLMKKLKAKKKKLAKLNELLGHNGGASRPDSTDVGSPNTVTSSTYNGSNCDEFFSELLSPATTASNLSPDSTGFLEMLANGQDGADHLDCGVYATRDASQTNTVVNRPNTENFLDEFLTQLPTKMETEELGAFELYF